jgi:hypothetical protein
MSNRNFDASVVTRRVRDKNVAQQIYGTIQNGRSVGNPQTANFNVSIMEQYEEGVETTTEFSLRSTYSFDVGAIANYVTLGEGGGDGPAPPPPPITDNLVLWYDPNDPASYPGSGPTINDLSLSPIIGTMANITFTSPSFSYNGISSEISVPDTAKLEPGAGNWTMEAWFNTTAFKTGGAGIILGKFDPGGLSQDVGYSIRTNNLGVVYAQMGDGSGNFVNSTTYPTALSTWAQVVYVWKNISVNSLETYINGVSIGSVSHTLNGLLNTGTPLYIGSYNGGEYAQWFNGKIGVVRLYNTALTDAEVLQNYNADKSTYGL